MEAFPYLQPRSRELLSVTEATGKSRIRLGVVLTATLGVSFGLGMRGVRRRYLLAATLLGSGLAYREWCKLGEQIAELKEISDWVALRENLSDWEGRVGLLNMETQSGWRPALANWWRDKVLLADTRKLSSSVPKEVSDVFKAANDPVHFVLLSTFKQYARQARMETEDAACALTHYAKEMERYWEGVERLQWDPYDESAYDTWKNALEACGYLSYYLNHQGSPLEVKATEAVAELASAKTASDVWKVLSLGSTPGEIDIVIAN